MSEERSDYAIEKRYFNLRELAEYTGLSTDTLRRYMTNFDLPHFRVNRKILVRMDEFEAWMETRRRLQNAEAISLQAVIDEVIRDFSL